MNLPANTTDRLLAVADRIEFQPDTYFQGQWWRREDEDGVIDYNPPPKAVVGVGHVCGTTACIAGWGVALATNIPAVFTATEDSWDLAGAFALGLDFKLAERLFGMDTDVALGGSAEVADVLRRLAKLPLGERTEDGARKVLTDAQLDAIFPDPEDSDDDRDFDDDDE
jgi:hypothetical protein